MFYVRFCNHKKIKKTVNTPLKGERLGLYLFLGLRYLNFLAIKLSLQRTAKTEQKINRVRLPMIGSVEGFLLQNTTIHYQGKLIASKFVHEQVH